ncbi:sensor histidine kinase [Achromobacter insuavis]
MDTLGVLVRNLLDNALRYTPEGGQIAVACGPGEGGAAWLRVADDGPGIAPRERARVFDRFYRNRAPMPAASASACRWWRRSPRAMARSWRSRQA